jgi:hypothetical protein
MSEEKNTTMPADFDISIAEDLGDNVKNNTVEAAPETSFEASTTPDTASEDSSVYEDLTQEYPVDEVTEVNTDVVLDAPDIAMGTLYQNVPDPNDTSVYEDLTHDHTPENEANDTPVADLAPANNKAVLDGSLDGIVWESEVEMDAHLDGNVNTSENENLNT